MSFSQSFNLAWQAVKDNRLRSTLTTLGVVIGIASVITLVTLGSSLQANLLAGFSGEGARLINVTASRGGPGAGPGAGPPGRAGQAVFTERDIGELASLAGTMSIIPRGTLGITAISHDGRTVVLNQVTATDPVLFEHETLAEGRPFAPGSTEAVIDASVAAFFPVGLDVGDDLTVRLLTGEDVTMSVTGILAAREGDFTAAFQGPTLYIPIEPFYTRTVTSPVTGTEQRVYPQLTVIAVDVAGIEDLQAQMNTYLTTSSDARELLPADYDFLLVTNEQILSQISSILDSLTGFVTGIALISLLVGSIGIANIMLVSVTERTREIGIMKAIGAQNSTILKLFLTEAVILGVIGAVLGTVFGIAAAYLATRLLEFPLALPYEWVGIAVIIGIVVGLVAGLYPAWRAARLDPIVALRYE